MKATGITKRWLFNSLGVILLILITLIMTLSFVIRGYVYNGIQTALSGRSAELTNVFADYGRKSPGEFSTAARNYVENFPSKESMGVVIGETTVIGDNCTLYQGVTLGGTGKDHGKRHPTLGNNVMVGAGAKVLGPFRVGDNARVAAGAVVLDEVPDNATAVGVPARVVRLNGVRPCNMDQIHIADPITQEFCRISLQLEKIQKQLDAAIRQKEEK